MDPMAPRLVKSVVCACLLISVVAGCKSKADQAQGATPSPPFMSAVDGVPPQTDGPKTQADDAPPPQKTGGFDGKRAYAHVAKQVGFGPRPSGSPAIAQTQQYLLSELSSYG